MKKSLKMEKQIKYWEQFYEKGKRFSPSSFARFCLHSFLKGKVIELGCGNGRDLYYFLLHGIKIKGVDFAFENHYCKKDDVEHYIKNNKSPNLVYTRFFWHAISDDLQLKILKWVKEYIFIEARTTEDKSTKKIFNDHYRNYVNVSELVSSLKKNKFNIEYLKEGRGLSKMGSENPHIIRIIARKVS